MPAHAKARSPFAAIRDHVLLRWAHHLCEVDEASAAKLTPEVVDAILAAVPEEWLEGADAGLSAADERESYRSYLLERLEAPRGFVEEAARVR